MKDPCSDKSDRWAKDRKSEIRKQPQAQQYIRYTTIHIQKKKKDLKYEKKKKELIRQKQRSTLAKLCYLFLCYFLF